MNPDFESVFKSISFQSSLKFSEIFQLFHFLFTGCHRGGGNADSSRSLVVGLSVFNRGTRESVVVERYVNNCWKFECSIEYSKFLPLDRQIFEGIVEKRALPWRNMLSLLRAL